MSRYFLSFPFSINPILVAIVVKTGQGLGVKCHYYSLLTGLSSIFKDSSLQVRSPHREYSTGSSTTVYLTILQDRLHHCELFSVYIRVCSLQYLVIFSRLAIHLPHSIFSHVLLVIGKQVSTSFAYRISLSRYWEVLVT